MLCVYFALDCDKGSNIEVLSDTAYCTVAASHVVLLYDTISNRQETFNYKISSQRVSVRTFDFELSNVNWSIRLLAYWISQHWTYTVRQTPAFIWPDKLSAFEDWINKDLGNDKDLHGVEKWHWALHEFYHIYKVLCESGCCYIRLGIVLGVDSGRPSVWYSNIINL